MDSYTSADVFAKVLVKILNICLETIVIESTLSQEIIPKFV